MGENKEAIVACNRILSLEEKRQFREMINERYRYQLFVDDLPSATMEMNDEGELEANFKEGLFVGKKYNDGSYVIYNHLDITVKTHHVSNGDEMRIVGLEVEQRSIANGESLYKGGSKKASEQYVKLANGQYEDMGDGLLFSYSIKTVNDESMEWSHRMDHYFAIGKYDVHMK